MTSKEQKQFSLIFKMAEIKGREAAAKCVPTPMVVAQHANPLDDNSAVKKAWVVPSGVCGFAWVTIPNAGSKAGRFAIKNAGARHSQYERGAVVNSPIEYGQSY